MSNDRAVLAIRRSIAVAAISCVATDVASAQIGHLPQTSPFQDQKIGQTLTISGGYLKMGSDPAQIAPRSSPLVSVRYDIGVGGPTAIYFRYTAAPTERNIVIPTRPAATRIDGTQSIMMHVADIGLDITLTGRKSWHGLMPSVTGGAGIASDFKDADPGGYKFGSKFAIAYGAALRIVPGGRISYRLDATNYYWQYNYPESYFTPASDQTAVLSDTKQKSVWKANWGLRAGVSWLLFP